MDEERFGQVTGFHSFCTWFLLLVLLGHSSSISRRKLSASTRHRVRCNTTYGFSITSRKLCSCAMACFIPLISTIQRESRFYFMALVQCPEYSRYHSGSGDQKRHTMV